jgi:DNA polymerase-3 subunit epsilon
MVFFDVETTGVNTQKDEIIQFAGIRLAKDAEPEVLQFLCKPSFPVPQEAIDIHGISNETLADKPSFKHFAKDIVKFMKGADVGGYNHIAFDLPMLDRQLRSCGYVDIFVNAAFYDAYNVFKKQYSGDLSSTYQRYTNKEMIDAHDAMADIKATIEVAIKQIEQNEHSDLYRLMDETAVSPDRRVGLTSTIIIGDDNQYIWNIGKYKGYQVKELPKSFIDWALKQDFEDSVTAILKSSSGTNAGSQIHIVNNDGIPTWNIGKYKGVAIVDLPDDFVQWVMKKDFPKEVLATIKKVRKNGSKKSV